MPSFERRPTPCHVRPCLAETRDHEMQKPRETDYDRALIDELAASAHARTTSSCRTRPRGVALIARLTICSSRWASAKRSTRFAGKHERTVGPSCTAVFLFLASVAERNKRV